MERTWNHGDSGYMKRKEMEGEGLRDIRYGETILEVEGDKSKEEDKWTLKIDLARSRWTMPKRGRSNLRRRRSPEGITPQLSAGGRKSSFCLGMGYTIAVELEHHACLGSDAHERERLADFICFRVPWWERVSRKQRRF